MNILGIGRLARLLNVLEQRDGCGSAEFFLGPESENRVDGEHSTRLWLELSDRERDEYRADAAKLAKWLETGE
jgi:hypothetical protein